MRSTRFALPLGFLIGFVATTAMARSPLQVEQEPADHAEVRTVMQTQIPEYLQQSQCGGWNMEESVEGRIATVTGVPGREGEWDAAKMSGMALREDVNGDENRNNDFRYPDSATGLTTACAQNTDQITKTVWRYVPGGRPFEIYETEVVFDHPKFLDPPCRWRIDKDGELLATAPDQPLIDNNPLTDNKYQYKEHDQSPLNRQNPQTCSTTCSLLNSFQYLDCAEPTWDFDFLTGELYRICPEPRPSDPSKPNMTPFFLCTDVPVDDNAETCTPGNPPTNYPNSRTCQGNTCRCPGPACASLLLAGESGASYDSYYRRYAGEYSRVPVPIKDEEGEVKKETAAKKADVACYGFYEEFDPRFVEMETKDFRCVINMDVAGMRESQMGKWTYGEESQWPDRDPTVKASQRKDGAFDEEEDLWFQRLGRSFSLINEKVFDETYDKDLSAVYLDLEKLDRGELSASYQLSEKIPLAQSSDIRAFDDTGDTRTLASWWQKQEQEVTELAHRQVVRLLLPAGWSFGVDADDPLFKRKDVSIAADEERRLQRIEVQIGAEEDILGTVLGYIERSLLLRVEEEPVPIVVPVGSPTEFRAKAQAWCSWYMRKELVDTCDDAPDEVKTLIEDLERYADEIERVRELRAELSRFAGEILKLQTELTKPIGDWVSRNIDEYQAILDEASSIRTLTEGSWKAARENMNELHGSANMPWCMNQRYTTPIYSLVPSQVKYAENGDKLVDEIMPNITVDRPEDIIIDLSTIAYMTGSITLPVLNPIQVRVTDIPAPPDTDSLKELPSLPAIDQIQLRIRQAISSLPKPPSDPPEPEPIEFDPIGKDELGRIAAAIDRIRDATGALRDTYKEFWESLSPLKPEEDSSDRNQIPEMKRQLDCLSWDSQPCKHVEMDLIERFTRIGSRPLVQLKEDYDAIGTPRMFQGGCIPEDDNCVPSHPESILPREQWDVIGPKTQKEFIDDLREAVRDLTLPQPVGDIERDNLPSYDTDINDLLPVHDIADPIDLSPPPENE